MSSVQSLCSMTHEEAIKILDAAIVEITTFNTPVYTEQEAESDGKYIKNVAIKALKDIGASLQMQQSIKDIYFGKYTNDVNLGAMCFGVVEATRKVSETYLQGVQNTINILQSERKRQERLMADKAERENLGQQKRSNRIQVWTLVFSIIAALAALYPIIESLIKRLLN